MDIRHLRPDETEPWLRLRQRLWPAIPRAEMESELADILDAAGTAVLVAAPGDAGGALAGFVEVALRDHAEGCRTSPVGYIEAWYVEPDHRRTGLGGRLIDAAERWAAARGCTEMASDTEVENEVSQRAHRGLGYAEASRLVLFHKRLGGGAGDEGTAHP